MSAYPVPPPDGAVRWAKYKARFERDAEGRLPEGSSDRMDKLMKSPAIMARVQASMDGLHALDTDTRVVLSAARVKLREFLWYHNFARELWGITNRVSGSSVADEAAALMAKWVVRGLEPEVLRKVAYEVFSIRIPEEE